MTPSHFPDHFYITGPSKRVCDEYLRAKKIDKKDVTYCHNDDYLRGIEGDFYLIVVSRYSSNNIRALDRMLRTIGTAKSKGFTIVEDDY